MSKIFIGSALFMLAACASLHKGPVVREGVSNIVVRATAPLPSEVSDEAQARALACDAAATLGQTHLLNRALQKKAASGKPLAEAEVPYIEIQKRVRDLVKNAKILESTVHDSSCTVTESIQKSDLKAILKDAK